MNDEQPPDDETGMLLTEFRHQIDVRLDRHRPERVSAGEKDWREPIYAWARNHMPDESHLVRRIAKQEVDGREMQATKRANNLLRDYMHGRAPLSWSLVGPLPVRVGKLRIRLDVATPKEVEDAARELLTVGQATFDEVAVLVKCLEELADEARQKGYLTVALIGDKPPHSQEDAA
jgi:hypothetical protein